MNRKPRVVLTSQDLERLETLLESHPANAFPGKNELRAELDRADVVEPEQIPPTVVTMNSTVWFRDMDSEEIERYTLVFPHQANLDWNRISVLAPIGTALLGYRQRDIVEWQEAGCFQIVELAVIDGPKKGDHGAQQHE